MIVPRMKEGTGECGNTLDVFRVPAEAGGYKCTVISPVIRFSSRMLSSLGAGMEEMR